MAWERCKACGAWRKVDIMVASDGWHQPPCYECGDPEYIEPFKEPIFSFEVPEQARFEYRESPRHIDHSPGLIFEAVPIQDQDISEEE